MRSARFIAWLALLGTTFACSPHMGEVFRRVRPPVAFEMMRDNPEIEILDLRPVAAYEGPDGHINGALCFPLEHLEARLSEIEPLKRRTFLVYCDATNCGELGLTWLLEEGFENVMLMEGGIDAWLRDGFRTVQVPEPPQEAESSDDSR